ncbi:MAG: hypothetical protein AAB035_02695 [Nitrospirota bacterium]
MTLTQITLFFLGILGVIVIAMLVHSYLDKKKIKKRLDQLTETLSGKVIQESRFHYPRFLCEINGRAFDLFFNVVKVGRHHILYSVYALAARLDHTLLLVKKDEFRPLANPETFLTENGSLLPQIHSPFQGYSKESDWAEQIYSVSAINKIISELDQFSSLQLGPDALVVGKPYEGLSDADSEKTIQAIKTLEKLAQAMEEATASNKK